MSKFIRGTRDAKGLTTLRRAPGGHRKIRCPSCGGLAIPAQSKTGKQILKCQGRCGSEFGVSRL
jgi:hypothetical protein